VQANLPWQVKVFGRPELPLSIGAWDAGTLKCVGGPEAHALLDVRIALRRSGHNSTLNIFSILSQKQPLSPPKNLAMAVRRNSRLLF
jgi:hypothetical protein